MNDYMRDQEVEDVKQMLRDGEWTHSATITCPKDHVSYWDVIEKIGIRMDRLRKIDNHASWIFVVNVNRDDERKRPHAHGVINTKASSEDVQKVMMQGFEHCRAFSNKKDRHGWFDYILDHAITGTTQHNLQREMVCN
jgi:hypothetical protein